MGGLGNQMFQYAFAMRMKAQGKNVKIDISYFDKIPPKDTKRYYELGIFNISIPLANIDEQKKYLNLYQILKNKLSEVVPCIQSKIVYEKSITNENDLFDLDDKYLIGFWQNERYFSDIRKIILDTYSFDESYLSVETKHVYDQLKKDNITVSIHIRGGDYLNAINKHIYGNVCEESYYVKACEYFVKKYKKVYFYVFSNDVKLARKYLEQIKHNIIFININNEKKDWEDMFLISKCKHNIIANSTFSWWGAWLNQNPDKEVVAPINWKIDGEDNDIVPNDWIRM